MEIIGNAFRPIRAAGELAYSSYGGLDITESACPNHFDAMAEASIRDRMKPWNRAGLFGSPTNRYAYTATKVS